jgi:prepilin-type processing-associated H-X9-DG protein
MTGRTPLSWLRQEAVSHAASHIIATLTKIVFLQDAGVDQWNLSRLNPTRAKWLAQIGWRSTNQYLQRLAPERRYPVLVAFLQQALLHHTDVAVERHLGGVANYLYADGHVEAIAAEAEVLEAQGHAVLGDSPAAASALDRAERLFDRAERASDPQWLGYFDEAYLSAKFGQTFTTLGRGDLALRFAERSLDMDEKYARGKQFNLALVARAHAQSGHVEEAAAAAHRAADAAEGIDSARSRDYLAEIANRLAPHAGIEPVDAARARVQELVAS